MYSCYLPSVQTNRKYKCASLTIRYRGHLEKKFKKIHKKERFQYKVVYVQDNRRCCTKQIIGI